MSGPYVVAIKPSARRLSAAAGEWVAEHGATRTFDSKRAARAWAADASDGGPVRIQDAAPNDPAPVDGYLVADPARRRSRGDRATGTDDEPVPLDRFGP